MNRLLKFPRIRIGAAQVADRIYKDESYVQL